MPLRPAPDWIVSEWLNAAAPIELKQLRGRVVFAVAFQMLCPGCVSHALPQAQRLRSLFTPDDLAVIGLHCVFEHPAAQGARAALEAFLHECRIGFPVGIDAHAQGDPLPATMRAYNMQGTPTTLLVDRAGRLRMQTFGHVDDLRLGAAVGALLGEGEIAKADAADARGAGCDDEGCAVG